MSFTGNTIEVFKKYLQISTRFINLAHDFKVKPRTRFLNQLSFRIYYRPEALTLSTSETSHLCFLNMKICYFRKEDASPFILREAIQSNCCSFNLNLSVATLCILQLIDNI